MNFLPKQISNNKIRREVDHQESRPFSNIFLVICIIISSCYSPRYVYSPPTQNIPQLNKKGDINLAGYFAAGGGSSSHQYPGLYSYNLGMDVHVTYALSDHFGLMVNKYNRWEKNDGANDFNPGDSAIVNYHRALTEFAAGYFTSSKRDRGNNFFQVFGGVAFGKFRIRESSLNNGFPFTRFHNSNITKLFVQPGFIFGQKRNFSTSFSSRLNAIFYSKIKTDYNSTDLDKYLLEGLSSSAVFFWEPAMTFSFGFNKIKGIRLNLQSGFAVLMNKRFIDYRTVNFAFGIIANKELFKGKRSKS
jgi:hypothetical protein